MKWKDTYNAANVSKEEDERAENYFGEPSYLSWKKSKIGKFFPQLFSRQEMPFVLIGLGILVLIILFFLFIPRGEKPVPSAPTIELEAKIKIIDEKLQQLETLGEKLPPLEAEIKKLELFKTRLDRMEASTSSRIDQLVRELEGLKKGPAAPPRAAAAAPLAEGETAAKATAPRYHTIVKGDTLYSLGRQYGTSTDTLLRLNKLTPKSTLRIGQKIMISPGKSE